MRLAFVKGSGHGPLVSLVGEPASLISCMAVSALLLMLTSPEALGPGPLPRDPKGARKWYAILKSVGQVDEHEVKNARGIR